MFIGSGGVVGFVPCGVVVLGEHYFSERPGSADRRGLVRARLRGLDLEFVTWKQQWTLFEYKTKR